MLSRNADSLYWLSRYMERAENTARILDVAYRLSSMPASYGPGNGNEWESALATASALDLFRTVHDEATPENVIEFLVHSDANPSSIRNCMEAARQNARAVRGSMTSEMWEAINGAWLVMRRFKTRDFQRANLPNFLNWAKEASLRFDGSAMRTMLRSDAYWFTRLGIHIERADNTARVLDVKYHVLLPREAEIGGGLDYYQWAAILRSVSALVSYQWVYQQNLKPWLIAEFLILRSEMPRSLAASYRDLTRRLDEISNMYGHDGPAQRQSRHIHTKLANGRIEDIFQSGLHEFLRDFIADNNKLGAMIADQYLV